MWLSKQQKQRTEERTARTGAVTIAGDRVAVELDGERRGLTVYGPGGYRWRPAAGEKVLVISSEDGLCVAGVPCEAPLEEGEVGLFAPGGAAVTLKKDGCVQMEGGVAVNGSFAVNGEELETIMRRIIAQELENGEEL